MQIKIVINVNKYFCTRIKMLFFMQIKIVIYVKKYFFYVN